MDYAADIEIAELALDAEWLDHSRRMFSYCSHAADTHREMDLAKERVDVVKAELDQQIRTNSKGFGLGEKVTEGAIQATILVQPEYQEATRAYIQRKYEYEVAQGAVKAFDHRKSALENLVRLHGQQYFAGPNVPHDLSEIRKQRDERRHERDSAAQRRVRVQRRT